MSIFACVFLALDFCCLLEAEFVAKILSLANVVSKRPLARNAVSQKYLAKAMRVSIKKSTTAKVDR